MTDPAPGATESSRARWETHYATGNTPWDTQRTPPEVQSFWASGRIAPQGLALDIGCGPATNVRYLAELGLLTIGFDIAYGAVAEGRNRILQHAPHLLPRALLVQADVTALPLTNTGAAYILDIGCSHGLPPICAPASPRASSPIFAAAATTTSTPSTTSPLPPKKRKRATWACSTTKLSPASPPP